MNYIKVSTWAICLPLGCLTWVTLPVGFGPGSFEESRSILPVTPSWFQIVVCGCIGRLSADPLSIPPVNPQWILSVVFGSAGWWLLLGVLRGRMDREWARLRARRTWRLSIGTWLRGSSVVSSDGGAFRRFSYWHDAFWRNSVASKIKTVLSRHSLLLIFSDFDRVLGVNVVASN